MRRLVLCGAAVFALAACSSGSDSVATTGTADATPSTAKAATETDDAAGEAPAASEPVVTEGGAAVDTTTTAPAPTTTEPATPLVDNGVSIRITSLPDGVGSQPLMDWDPVEGAAEYRVVVRDADLESYWAWTGADDQVRLGGGESPDGGGPSAPEGSSWSVVALDADGVFLASSAWVFLVG